MKHLHSRQRSNHSKNLWDADVVGDWDGSNGYESVGIMVVKYEDSGTEWMIDSGCSFHVCPSRSQFCSYREIDGGTVRLGDNRSCAIVEIGTIMLRLPGGAKSELRHVRHVPEIKKNSISVAMLDKDGYTVKVENGMLNVKEVQEPL